MKLNLIKINFVKKGYHFGRALFELFAACEGVLWKKPQNGPKTKQNQRNRPKIGYTAIGRQGFAWSRNTSQSYG